jgi:hypothetical protein
MPPVCLRNIGEGDVVVADAAQAGEDLGEGRHDEVLAVPGVQGGQRPGEGRRAAHNGPGTYVRHATTGYSYQETRPEL